MTQNDPQEAPLTKYIKYIVQDSVFKTFWFTFSHRNGSNLPLILHFNLEAFRGWGGLESTFFGLFSPY